MRYVTEGCDGGHARKPFRHGFTRIFGIKKTGVPTSRKIGEKWAPHAMSLRES